MESFPTGACDSFSLLPSPVCRGQFQVLCAHKHAHERMRTTSKEGLQTAIHKQIQSGFVHPFAAIRSGVAKLDLRYVVYYHLTRDHELVSFAHVSDHPLTPFAPQGTRGKRIREGGGSRSRPQGRPRGLEWEDSSPGMWCTVTILETLS